MKGSLQKRQKDGARRSPFAEPQTGSRSAQIGVIGTILFHLLLFHSVPDSFLAPLEPDPSRSRELEIQLMPDEEIEPDPFRFVEANPDVPDNPPDQTENFARQNQQAANPDPDPTSRADAPRTEGEDRPSTQIVTGEFSEPIFTQPTPEQMAQLAEMAEQSEAQQPEEMIPLPGTEKVEGDDEEGVGFNIAEVSPLARPVPEPVEGVQNPNPNPDGIPVVNIDPTRPQPQPRPRLQQVRPGILQNRPISAPRDNLQVAWDAKFSEFGDYLQKLIETVHVQWERILLQRTAFPRSGSHATITFVINSEGQIARILEVDENTGSVGTYSALEAIQARQPYGAWTRDMIAVLGNEQVLVFSFHY